VKALKALTHRLPARMTAGVLASRGEHAVSGLSVMASAKV